jgi:hypothetical protein
MLYREVLLLVGQLNYTWTNTESLLIYLIAGLARTDRETAIIIFLTLNTTKARIELVERLAKMATTAPSLRASVLAITDQLSRQSRLRNKYSHCIYSFDETGTRASTQLMRLVESKDSVRYGKVEALDGAEIERITACINGMQDTNKQIWAIIEANDFPR